MVVGGVGQRVSARVGTSLFYFHTAARKHKTSDNVLPLINVHNNRHYQIKRITKMELQLKLGDSSPVKSLK